MRAGGHLLADITSLLEINGIKPVETGLQHQRPFRNQINRSLRYPGGDPAGVPCLKRRHVARIDGRWHVAPQADPAPAKIGMARIDGGAVRRIAGPPANPDAQFLFLRQVNRAAQPVAAQSCKQVIGARGIAFQQESLCLPVDHHVGKDSPLRGQQRARPA